MAVCWVSVINALGTAVAVDVDSKSQSSLTETFSNPRKVATVV